MMHGRGTSIAAVALLVTVGAAAALPSLRIIDVLKTTKTVNFNDDPMTFFKTIGPALLQTDEVAKVGDIFKAGVTSEIGHGFVVGYAGGFTMKKVSQFLAIVVGGAFIVIQWLSYNDVISINHNKLEDIARKVFDMSKDGKAAEMLGNNLPSGGGFAVGLALGLCT